ncbi:uncharacterized protein K452DRAFT_287140 [Aplosporella prunicola CBS 121167]|uniref:SAP domain-containing protein n=1 Tax=Aplosporella prunicola CBS 121167 TaxID=1176127 RepID=A0A6A6BCM4_9PEZI|nr:uncharacterized protein K452DRAFT_287140 [Aplosporella prunicola CBS 121167]KAF2141949.1 hypothetical protein K452DRAFT_287140 [Aplosporella prunicola CBS 121167]
MSDYAKMKNAELEALLKQRNLPHTGKKADMVARLQEADKVQPGDAPVATTANAEDEIDWDDDTTTDAAGKPAASTATSEAAAAAVAAGGQGPVDNPQAVPNQVVDTDPSKTDDLSVKPPGENEATAADDGAAPTTEAAEPAVPKKDYTSGLKETTLEEEIEKRKARAKKFGIPDDEISDAQKLLERQKKFGETGGPKGLNEALPERREKKRAREASDEGGAGGRGGFKKRGRGGRFQGGGRRGGERREGGGGNKEGNASGNWLNENDKAKAEARKARFEAAPSTS